MNPQRNSAVRRLQLLVLLAFSLGATGCATNLIRLGDGGGSGAPDATLSAFIGNQSIDEMLQSGIWQGSFQTSYDRRSQKLRSPGSPEYRASGQVAATSVSISNTGWAVLDPRLLSGNVGLRFALQSSATDAAGSGQKSVLTDYSLDAVALQEMPYSAALGATRSQGTNTIFGGGTSNVTHENRTIGLRMREDNYLREVGLLPWLSANLRIAQEHAQEDTRSAGNRFQRDDSRNTMSLDAHSGFETADLDFRYEQSEFTDRVRTSSSYESRTANLGYSLDFGPTLNRRWDSRIGYTSRAGARDTSNLSIDESLSIAHFSNLSSAYNLSVLSQTTPEGATTFRSGGVNVRHQLYNNLTTTVGLSGSRTELFAGTLESKGAQMSFSYSHGLPWEGQLVASLGGSVKVNNNQLASSFLGVFEVPYQAPPVLGAGSGFLLNDRFVAPDTITILAIKGGARVPTIAGIDYQVVAEGDQVRILPEITSAVIQPNDVLLISYQYRIEPSAAYRSDSRSLGLAVDWGFVGASYSHQHSSQRPTDGSSSDFLGDSSRDVLRLNLHRAWEATELRADATIGRFRDPSSEYQRAELSQYLIYRPSFNWMVSASAHQYRTTYVSPSRQSTGNSLAVNAEWLAPGGWRTSANLSRRQLQDTDIPSETITELALRANRKWTKLTVDASLISSHRARGGVSSDNVSIHFNVVRRF